MGKYNPDPGTVASRTALLNSPEGRLGMAEAEGGGDYATEAGPGEDWIAYGATMCGSYSLDSLMHPDPKNPAIVAAEAAQAAAGKTYRNAGTAVAKAHNALAAAQLKAAYDVLASDAQKARDQSAIDSAKANLSQAQVNAATAEGKLEQSQAAGLLIAAKVLESKPNGGIARAYTIKNIRDEAKRQNDMAQQEFGLAKTTNNVAAYNQKAALEAKLANDHTAMEDSQAALRGDNDKLAVDQSTLKADQDTLKRLKEDVEKKNGFMPQDQQTNMDVAILLAKLKVKNDTLIANVDAQKATDQRKLIAAENTLATAIQKLIDSKTPAEREDAQKALTASNGNVATAQNNLQAMQAILQALRAKTPAEQAAMQQALHTSAGRTALETQLGNENGSDRATRSGIVQGMAQSTTLDSIEGQAAILHAAGQNDSPILSLQAAQQMTQEAIAAQQSANDAASANGNGGYGPAEAGQAQTALARQQGQTNTGNNGATNKGKPASGSTTVHPAAKPGTITAPNPSPEQGYGIASQAKYNGLPPGEHYVKGPSGRPMAVPDAPPAGMKHTAMLDSTQQPARTELASLSGTTPLVHDTRFDSSIDAFVLPSPKKLITQPAGKAKPSAAQNC